MFRNVLHICRYLLIHLYFSNNHSCQILRFWVPKKSCWWYDDLRSYLNDFLKNVPGILYFSTLKGYFYVICKHLWWFFCILCLFNYIKDKKKNCSFCTRGVPYTNCPTRMRILIVMQMANRLHTNMLPKKYECYIGIHDSPK